MSEHCPMVTCRLTDQFGNEINPFSPNAIVYSKPLNIYDDTWSVAIEGYIAIYSREERISPPLPFCIMSSFCLNVPKGCSIAFVLESFNAWAVICKPICPAKIGHIKLLITIETLISSQKSTYLLVPQMSDDLNELGRVCIHADRIFDSSVVQSNYGIYYKNAELRAEICQYTAIADGIKRTFRDEDAVKNYSHCKILSPEEVSYANVFVNGVLQPQKNYVIKKGEISFTTDDVPSQDKTIIILFVTWKNFEHQIMDALQWQYSAISNGIKKTYVNEDEIPEYESYGIPAPGEVSYFNLYINGVLQPRRNYCIKKGVLQLTTKNAPPKGAYVILESIIIHDSKGGLFRAETASFNTYSNGGKIYTDKDNIEKDDICGIPCPDETSYQNLFVNAVLQPHANYIVQKGCLILTTEGSPSEDVPITLQSVSSSPAVSCCETQFSDAALAQLKKSNHI